MEEPLNNKHTSSNASFRVVTKALLTTSIHFSTVELFGSMQTNRSRARITFHTLQIKLGRLRQNTRAPVHRPGHRLIHRIGRNELVGELARVIGLRREAWRAVEGSDRVVVDKVAVARLPVVDQGLREHRRVELLQALVGAIDRGDRCTHTRSADEGNTRAHPSQNSRFAKRSAPSKRVQLGQEDCWPNQ